MLWNRLVIGYHGCDADVAKEVVCKAKELQPSKNDYDWLGSGIYFWEGSPERARQWAIDASLRKDSNVKSPGILGAVIDLGECLNLIEAENLDIVRKSYDIFENVMKVSGTPLPKNAGKDMAARKLDRAVFEFLHLSRKEANQSEFDTVRAFFVEGTELYPTSGIRHMDHIQICVRSPAQIIGTFLP